MNKFSTAILAATILTGASAVSASADEAKGSIFGDSHNWMIRARAIDVHPDSSSKASGASVFVDNAIVPELDITYFWNENLATELILATSPHDLKTAAGAALGDAWVLPPQLVMQYHFLPKNQIIRPYAGAGIGYMHYFNENGAGATRLDLKDGFSYTAQIGADFPIDEHWAFNVDAKRVYTNVVAKINGAKAADVNLNPWVVGVGIGYRF